MLIMIKIRCPYCKKVVYRLWKRDGIISAKISDTPCSHYVGIIYYPKAFIKYNFYKVAEIEHNFYLFYEGSEKRKEVIQIPLL